MRGAAALLTVVVSTLIVTPAMAATRPVRGACYFGEFKKQSLLSPPSWAVWPTGGSVPFYSDFSLIVAPSGRSLSARSNAHFVLAPAAKRPPYPYEVYDRIDLFRGSHNARITRQGVFQGSSGASDYPWESLGGEFTYTHFRGQFLSGRRVLFKFRTRSWGGVGRPFGDYDDLRTGWVIARGRTGDPMCGHDFPEF